MALLYLLPAALVLAGLVAIGVAVATAARRRRRDAGAVSAEALVVRLERRVVHTGPGDRAPVLFPVLRFRLPDGREVELESRTGAAPAPAREGERVQVRFDPADPSDVHLASAGAGGLASLVLGAVGGGLVVIGAVTLLALLALG